MGKGMKAKPKGKGKRKYQFDQSDVNKLKHEIVQKLSVITTACYMDEACYDEEKQCYIDGADDKVLAFWERLARYTKAIDEHDISLKKVEEIIKDSIQLDINW